MPVTCDLDLEALSTQEFGDLDYVVMGHAYKVHRQLGRLADEQIYEANLSQRLNGVAGLESVQQVPIVVTYDSFQKT